MGLLKFWRKTPLENPMADAMWAMVDEVREARREARVWHQEQLEAAREQRAVIEQWLELYTAKGENTTSTLDTRLFAKEEEWEPMVTDEMFTGLGA